MRKGMIYAFILSAALLMPSTATELGKMKPVEVLALQYIDDQYVLSTDTGDYGSSATLKAAIAELHATTSGRIYLDTTAYLLVSQDARINIKDLSPYMKRSVRRCGIEGNVDLQAAGQYLRTHRPAMKLRQWQEGAQLEVLSVENGRMKLS